MTFNALSHATSFRVEYKNIFKFGVNYNEKFHPVMRVIKLNFEIVSVSDPCRVDEFTVLYNMKPLIIYPWDESILMLAGVAIPHYIDVFDSETDYFKLDYPGQSKITLDIHLTVDDLLNHTTTGDGLILKFVPGKR